MSHVEEALQYAVDVVDGKIPNCQHVITACKRFLDDLERSQTEEYPYYFDVDAARRMVNFAEKMPHVKGRWQKKKETLKAQLWQKFIFCNLFGWKRKDNDLRRFREAYIKIPRKNGKSFIAAVIANKMFVNDDESGAEVYVGATKEVQAWEVFRPAKLMVERSDWLRETFDIQVNAKTMCVLSDGSRMEPLIGNPGDGSSPSCAIVDEYHEHDKDDLYETMSTGMMARDQPLMLVITTAGSNLAGPCFQKERDSINVLNGMFEDEQLFVLIYGIDPDDDWSDPEMLKKANPNYGVSVDADAVLRGLAKAKRSPKDQNAFRTKHLNQWVGAKSAWMNILAWMAQKKVSKFEEFREAPCQGAVDLASRKDVACVCLLWKNGEEYYTKQWFFVPESALEYNDKYPELVNHGCLIVTPGNKTDQEFIEEKIKELQKDYRVQSWAFDDYQGDYIMTRLEAEGFEVVNYGQTVKNMSAPMKEVEAQVLDKKLYNDGNECMNWMMGNVVFSKDAKDNIFPRKENDNDPNCKIDGPVSLIMAMGRWLAYEDRGSLDDFLNDTVIV